VDEQEFIDRIIRGFETMRERPHLDFLAEQFTTGEIMFIVDRRGIRITPQEDTDDTCPVELD
jgi:hypothetical protein